MKLSEEIRLGSLLVTDPREGDIANCAFGMANRAVGLKVASWEGYAAPVRRHPWLEDRANHQCPWCSVVYSMPMATIVHAFDAFDAHVMVQRKLTIEQLVDWIASIEPPETPEVTPQHDSTYAFSEVKK